MLPESTQDKMVRLLRDALGAAQNGDLETAADLARAVDLAYEES